MKKSIGYYLLMAATWPMQLFPLEFHYILSDFLFFLVYRVFGYRRTVVARNLKKSFPDKTSEELMAIEKKFYHGFTDMFVETLYFTHVNIQKEKKRLELVNFDQFNAAIERGQNIICVAGHFGNWEYMQLFSESVLINKYFVYKKINNKAFDQFYRELRGRAASPLEMKETFRTLMNDINKKEQYAAYFISDQRPLKHEIKHWVNFMNQETPVMLGTEKIAKKTKAAVLYMEVSKIKRGYHRVTFELLFEHPEETAPYEITNTFMSRLEKSINQYPDQYLWTHNRWKYKKENQ